MNTWKPESGNKQREQVQKVQVCFIVAVDKLITHATGNAEASLSLMRCSCSCCWFFFFYQQSERSQQMKNKTRGKQLNNLQILYRFKYATICTMIHLDYSPLVQQSQKLQVCHSSVLAPTHSVLLPFINPLSASSRQQSESLFVSQSRKKHKNEKYKQKKKALRNKSLTDAEIKIS